MSSTVDRRQRADAAIASLLSTAAGKMPSTVRAVEQSWLALKALRQEVERDFAVPLDARDKTLPDFTMEQYTQKAVPALDSIIEMVDGIDQPALQFVDFYLFPPSRE